MIEIYQLKYFKEITKTLNYTRAAETLHLSRQALTKSIRKMEQEIGGRLFEIRDNSLALTPLGRRVLNEAEPILLAYDRFCLTILPSVVEYSSLSIVFSTGASLSLPSNTLSEFHRLHPEVSITAEEASSDGVTRMVRQEEAEIGLVGSLPEYLKEFDVILVRRTGTWLWIPEGHPLYFRNELFVEDLKDLPLVTAGRHNHLQQYIETECAKAGFSPTLALMTSDTDILRKYAVEHRMAFFTFPPHIQPPDTDAHVIPLRLPKSNDINTYAVKQKGRRLSNSGQCFWEHLKTIPKKDRGH